MPIKKPSTTKTRKRTAKKAVKQTALDDFKGTVILLSSEKQAYEGKVTKVNEFGVFLKVTDGSKLFFPWQSFIRLLFKKK